MRPRQFARGGSCAREFVVHEHHPVPDEYAVAELDPVTDEGVALDLAATTDHRAPLDLHERADPRPVADTTAVEVRERVDEHSLAEVDIVDQPEWSVVRRSGAHDSSDYRP